MTLIEVKIVKVGPTQVDLYDYLPVRIISQLDHGNNKC